MRAISFFTLLWAAGLMLMFQGCDMNFGDEPMPVDLTFELLIGSQYVDGDEFTSKGSRVLINSRDYQNEFFRYTGRKPPEVEFLKNSVLLLDMGFRESGGYFSNVTAVKEFSDYVEVDVALTKPGENCVVTNAFTNPYQFLRIPTKKEILVSEKLIVKNCR